MAGLKTSWMLTRELEDCEDVKYISIRGNLHFPNVRHFYAHLVIKSCFVLLFVIY